MLKAFTKVYVMIFTLWVISALAIIGILGLAAWLIREAIV